MTMTSSRTDAIVPAVVQFTLEGGAYPHLIRAYSEHEVRIGTQRIRSSCIVNADTLISDWEPATFAALRVAHLARLFALKPELVLLATGPRQQFANSEIRAAFAQAQVGLEVMQLGAACRTFNVLLQEERRVAAALFLR
jgi:uncharacterized protein